MKNNLVQSLLRTNNLSEANELIYVDKKET